MTKRIYFNSVKKWLIASGAVTATLVGGLFLYLSLIGAITITGYSGDYICMGTIEDPCYAYINFTANEDVFIYPIDYDPWGRDTPLNFNPAIKSWKLQRKWGSGWRNIPLNETCTGTWCGAPNNKGVAYSYVFRENHDYEFRIVGYKNSPNDNIKWGFFKLDPTWEGINGAEIPFIVKMKNGNITFNTACYFISDLRTEQYICEMNNYSNRNVIDTFHCEKMFEEPSLSLLGWDRPDTVEGELFECMEADYRLDTNTIENGFWCYSSLKDYKEESYYCTQENENIISISG